MLHQLAFRRDTVRTEEDIRDKIISPTQLAINTSIKSNSKDIALILCVSGWTMLPGFREDGVTAVGTVSTGKASRWIVTRKK